MNAGKVLGSILRPVFGEGQFAATADGLSLTLGNVAVGGAFDVDRAIAFATVYDATTPAQPARKFRVVVEEVEA